MSAYGCRADDRSEAFLCEKTKENSTPLGEKVKKEVKKLLKARVIKRIPANEAG